MATITLKKTGYFREVTPNVKYVLSKTDWRSLVALGKTVYGEGITVGVNVTGAGTIVLTPSLTFTGMTGEYKYPSVASTVTNLSYTFDSIGLKFISIYLPMQWDSFYLNFTGTATAEIDFAIEEKM